MIVKTKLTIQHEITDSRLAHLLCTALESGHSSWAQITHTEEPKVPDRQKPWGDEYTPSYIYSPLSKGGFIQICDIEDGGKKYAIARLNLQQGLITMATDYPKHFADFLTGNDDAITADVFLQCAVLGDVVYG